MHQFIYLHFFLQPLFMQRDVNKHFPRRKTPVDHRVESFVFMRPKFHLTCITTSGNQTLNGHNQDPLNRFPWEHCELIPVVKACDYVLVGRLQWTIIDVGFKQSGRSSRIEQREIDSITDEFPVTPQSRVSRGTWNPKHLLGQILFHWLLNTQNMFLNPWLEAANVFPRS